MEHIFPDVAVSIDLYCLQINSGVKSISFLDSVPVWSRKDRRDAEGCWEVSWDWVVGGGYDPVLRTGPSAWVLRHLGSH